MAAGAMLLDRHTVGRIVTNAPHLRELSGVGPTPDGTSMTDLAHAIKVGYDIDIKNPGPYEPFSSFESKVASGRGAVIAGDCAYVRGQARCPAGLSKNHALYVNEVDDEGMFLVMDPVDRTASEGTFRLSRAQLRRYASNWTGVDGMVNAGYSRRTSLEGGNGNGGGIELGSLPAVGGVALGVGAVALVAGGAVLVWYLGRGKSVLAEDE